MTHLNNMLIVLSAIAFFYAYLSFQDNEMISFYISLLVGIILIGFMLNNIIQVKKMKKKNST